MKTSQTFHLPSTLYLQLRAQSKKQEKTNRKILTEVVDGNLASIAQLLAQAGFRPKESPPLPYRIYINSETLTRLRESATATGTDATLLLLLCLRKWLGEQDREQAQAGREGSI